MSKVSYSFPWGVYVGDIEVDTESTPIMIDSQKRGFSLLFDEVSSSKADDFLENIALSLIDVLPLDVIEVKAFDFGKNRFLHLSSLKDIGIYEVAFNLQKAKNLFETIEEIAQYRHHNLLSSDIQAISEYNLQEDEKERYYLLLINLKDFTQDVISLKRAKDFFDSAFEAGIFTLFFGDSDTFSKDDKVTNYLLEKFAKIELKNGKFLFNKKIFKYFDMLEDGFEPLNQNKKTLTSKIKNRYEQKEENTLEKNFLHIPIGQAGRETIYLDMGLKSALYNAFITGKTGSGKSVLLHNVIVEIAKNYTAKEIELYLMDYNAGGLEFVKYKNHPNCKKLFLGVDSPDVTLDMIQEFIDEMDKRANLMQKAGVSLIDRYNQKNPTNPLPYKILIIDEVQEMFSKGWKNSGNFNTLLTKLAKQGRKFGLHFIFATQSLENIDIDKSILGQIDIKISFKLNKQMEAMKIFDEKEAYSKVTKLQNYHFIYQTESIKTAKSNFLDESSIEETLEEIRAKRKADEILTPIIIKQTDKPKTREDIPKEKPKREGYKPKYSTDEEKRILEEFQRKVGSEG